MNIAVDKDKIDQVIAAWAKGACGDCLLGNNANCKKWNDVDCKAKIERALGYEQLADEWLLSWQERGLLEIFSQNYNYIARDKNGELFMYVDKPNKTRTNWEVKRSIYGVHVVNTYFLPVQWNDDEPWLISDLLQAKKTRIDWAKIPVDTKVLVRDKNTHTWAKRHFAKFKNGKAFVYPMGLTSFTTNGDLMTYKYVQLAKDEEKYS